MRKSTIMETTLRTAWPRYPDVTSSKPATLTGLLGDLVLDETGVYFLALGHQSSLTLLSIGMHFIPFGQFLAGAAEHFLRRMSHGLGGSERDKLRMQTIEQLLLRKGSRRVEWAEVREVESSRRDFTVKTEHEEFSFTGSKFPLTREVEERYSRFLTGVNREHAHPDGKTERATK